MDFAQLTLQGRLTEDPTTRNLDSGTTVCKFTVASNRRIPGSPEERTTFTPVTVFGSDAQNCAKYLTKGREVHVTGDFETDSYTDGKGIQRKGFNVIARTVIFGRGGKKAEGEIISEADVVTTKETLYRAHVKNLGR